MSEQLDPFRTLSAMVSPVDAKITARKDSALPYVGLESIPSRGAKLIGWAPASTSISTNAVFRAGDVLFGKLRPNLRKCLVAPFDGYCSTDILVLRPNLGVEPGYAGKVLRSERVGAAAVMTAVGTKMPRTSWKHLRELKVFCPAFDEQLKIDQILDALDTAIQETEAIIAKLKAVKQGLLHDLLTRGIDANGELRPPQAEAPRLYKESPLGCTPKEWRHLSLNEVCNRIGDGVHYAVPRCSEGVPFLFVSCIRNGRISWADAAYVSRKTFREISTRAMPRPGMVLYTVVGSYGYAAHVDDAREFGFERNIAFLFPNEHHLDSKYLFHFLTSSVARAQVERLVIGNAQKVLTLSSLGSMVIALPAIPEQIEVGRRLASITVRQELEEAALKKLCSEKAGLLDDLLTGRVRVTELLNSAATMPA